MKTVFISILAISLTVFSAQAAGVSQEMKNLQEEAVKHRKQQNEKLAEAYKQYQATKTAAAAAHKSANLQAEKDFKKAKEQISQENKDFNAKYKEIKLNLTKKKVDVKTEAQPEAKPEEPKKEEVKK